MEPQVQYAKTSDGVDIAFASMGEGPPLIRLPPPGFAHVQRDWAMYPAVFQQLTPTVRLIWYDLRGTGLSDRDATDFSMYAMMRDVKTIPPCYGQTSDKTEERRVYQQALKSGPPSYPSVVSGLGRAEGVGVTRHWTVC